MLTNESNIIHYSKSMYQRFYHSDLPLKYNKRKPYEYFIKSALVFRRKPHQKHYTVRMQYSSMKSAVYDK